MRKEEKIMKEKEELKNTWEKIFEEKIEDHLTEIGLKRFWSPKTSVAGAEMMLTKAATIMFLESVLGKNAPKGKHIEVIILGEDDDEDEKWETAESEKEYCEGSKPKKFAVLEKEDDHVYPDRFETDEEAYDFIKVICMNTSHTFDDFKVIQEM